jgi:hypothetical protein
MVLLSFSQIKLAEDPALLLLTPIDREDDRLAFHLLKPGRLGGDPVPARKQSRDEVVTGFIGYRIASDAGFDIGGHHSGRGHDGTDGCGQPVPGSARLLRAAAACAAIQIRHAGARHHARSRNVQKSDLIERTGCLTTAPPNA